MSSKNWLFAMLGECLSIFPGRSITFHSIVIYFRITNSHYLTSPPFGKERNWDRWFIIKTKRKRPDAVNFGREKQCYSKFSKKFQFSLIKSFMGNGHEIK